MTDDELDLMPAETLFKSLARRFDSVVLAGCTHIGSDATNYTVEYAGRNFECIGLAHYIATEISKAQISDGEQD